MSNDERATAPGAAQTSSAPAEGASAPAEGASAPTERSRASSQGSSAPAGSTGERPWVGVIMGGRSDWEHLSVAAEILNNLGIPHEVRVVSAHRTPDRMFEYAESAAERGLEVIIAAAGGAAHLPGMVAAKSLLPVIGVPIPATALNGLDALLSIVQMPKGVPVATMAIGKPGAANAALFAAAILSAKHPELRDRLAAFRAEQQAAVLRDSILP